MSNNYSDKEKEAWRKNENKTRSLLIGFIVAFIIMLILVIFFRSQVWAMITSSAIIIGLIVDSCYLINLLFYNKKDVK